jgi:hypothetical protein
MCISHVCNNSCRNATARLAKKSRPEVGYWVTLEGHQKNIGETEDGGDGDRRPNDEFLIYVLTYLQQ